MRLFLAKFLHLLWSVQSFNAFAIFNAFHLQVFLEQKKILKMGLNMAQFRRHVPLIVEETQEYFKRWGEKGEKGKKSVKKWRHFVIHL